MHSKHPFIYAPALHGHLSTMVMPSLAEFRYMLSRPEITHTEVVHLHTVTELKDIHEHFARLLADFSWDDIERGVRLTCFFDLNETPQALFVNTQGLSVGSGPESLKEIRLKTSLPRFIHPLPDHELTPFSTVTASASPVLREQVNSLIEIIMYESEDADLPAGVAEDLGQFAAFVRRCAVHDLAHSPLDAALVQCCEDEVFSDAFEQWQSKKSNSMFK